MPLWWQISSKCWPPKTPPPKPRWHYGGSLRGCWWRVCRIGWRWWPRCVRNSDTGEALPLLAFTLQQLAEGVGWGGQLSAERYQQLGGVTGAFGVGIHAA